ncbi:MAG: phospholipase [Candidatus Nealsonbacteria bacterium]|nr:phospholipase [Candidatus Nealsonbacteria bacterium]
MTPSNVDAGVLRTLHRIHRQLGDLQGRLNRLPKQIRAVEAYVAHQEELLKTATQQSKAVRVASDAKQVQLKGGEGKVVELGAKLNTSASNREYQALKDQIAAQQMTNSVLEDEILESLDKIEASRQTVAEAEAALATARKKSATVHSEAESQTPVIEADVARLQAELRECEARLPAEAREPYNRVIRHHGDDALAAVQNQFCGGCNQHVPLNVVAEIMLKKPKFCKSCGRMLYMPEDAENEE